VLLAKRAATFEADDSFDGVAVNKSSNGNHNIKKNIFQRNEGAGAATGATVAGPSSLGVRGGIDPINCTAASNNSREDFRLNNKSIHSSSQNNAIPSNESSIASSS